LKLWSVVGLPDHAGWSELLFSSANSCVIFQLQLFGQLFPQQGETVQFWILPSGSGDQLCDPLPALLWRWLIAVFVYWEFSPGSLILCPVFFFQGRFSVPPTPSTVHARLQFAVCFSIFQGYWVLDTALRLRRSVLWSTTCPALRSGLSPTCS
jgi:hypothetical protein